MPPERANLAAPHKMPTPNISPLLTFPLDVLHQTVRYPSGGFRSYVHSLSHLVLSHHTHYWRSGQAPNKHLCPATLCSVTMVLFRSLPLIAGPILVACTSDCLAAWKPQRIIGFASAERGWCTDYLDAYCAKGSHANTFFRLQFEKVSYWSRYQASVRGYLL